jgi:DNA-binding beta-propeller fold protein YncE
VSGARTLAFLLAVPLLLGSAAAAAPPDPLTLERTIPLGQVQGRIDHMAVDLARERLFVAELGNGSLGVVDLEKGEVAQRIGGLEEPQGVAYVPGADLLYVASGGDGTLRRYAGADLGPAGVAELGQDADNVRVDPRGGRVVVGYGDGALALVEAGSGTKAGEIALPGHPESFRLEADGARAFVNVPAARQVVVVDRDAGRQVAAWDVPGRDNFPMILDEASGRLLVVDRHPPELLVLDTASGKVVARLPTCGDADDVFWDAKRERVYVSCGEGAVDIVQRRGDAYEELARVPTASGARTALFVPELDRLYVAVRAGKGEGAAIRVLRPAS